MVDDKVVEVPDTIEASVPRKPREKEFVRSPGKTLQDKMPVDQRPRVKAAQERYKALRQSQGLDA